MLDPRESQDVQNLFSANEAQVRRDHAISHVLATLQRINTELVFFGGRYGSRTHILNGGTLVRRTEPPSQT